MGYKASGEAGMSYDSHPVFIAQTIFLRLYNIYRTVMIREFYLIDTHSNNGRPHNNVALPMHWSGPVDKKWPVFLCLNIGYHRKLTALTQSPTNFTT